MRGEPKHMTSHETACEMAELIRKRMAQGLSKTMIAARLGITTAVLENCLKRGVALATEAK